MKLAKIKNRIKSVVMASALSLALLAGFPAVEAQAATGSVYTCTINRCYAHPVTGVVEDSGGAGSYATGQGMVEGCVYPTGILEVADDGNYYLTIRMSLMDYTSGHDFQVQSVGDSGWSSTGYAQTGTGSDSNGTTADVVIQVPSENCIVRGTMYVEPMGRNVVFYLYPSDYKEGNNTDMNATMVTGSAASNGTAAESSSDGGSAVSGSSGSISSGNSSLQSSGSTSSDSSTGSASSGKKLQSSISEAAKPSSESETPSTDSSTVSTIPDRYKDVETVGTAMSPDTEILSSLKPDWILSPVSLQSDLQPKYEAIGSDWAFLNLRSVPGMYRSIQELGEIFDRQDQADKLVKEFTEFYDDYKKKNEGKDHSKVMILMGLPGSYIIATPNSYVGSLVELAGGENVYSDTNQEFLTVNTEDMKTKEPDIILRAAHALPDQVVEMFNKDFAENDIWQHFDAVKNGRVYDLTYEYFGMSATFKYPQALEELQPILYPESDEDTQKAKEASDNAQKKAKDSDATEKCNEQQSK